MARAQNAPNGLFVKEKVQSTQLAVSSTATLSGATTVSGVTTLPTQVTLGTVNVRSVSNSTGVAFQINTTGTTWVYVSTTTVQPA